MGLGNMGLGCMGGSWIVSRVRDRAGAIHSRDPWVGGPARQVWFCECLRPAVVLGSTQPQAHVDLVRACDAGLDVVRRRSGGGAVRVVPGETLWVEVAVPREDPLWVADVGGAFAWLGRVWADTLDSLNSPGSGWGSTDLPGSTGAGRATVHEGPLVASAFSTYACFAGLGPGEVSVGGRKVVGISQRRTREGAVFHCALYSNCSPSLLVEVLAMDQHTRSEARAALDARSTSLGAVVGRNPSLAEVEAAFLAGLPWGLV